MKNYETRLRTPAAVTGLTVAEESAAARQTLRLLKTLQNALKKGLADGDDVHWVDDLTQLTPDAALFLFQTLGRGEVTLHLYGGEAQAEETQNRPSDVTCLRSHPSVRHRRRVSR